MPYQPLRLSPELTDTIIDEVAISFAPPGALKACALTCRGWLPRSTYHLFRRFNISHRDGKAPPDLEFLRQSHRICKNITWLTMNLGSEQRFSDCCEAISSFPRLESLTFSYLRIGNQPIDDTTFEEQQAAQNASWPANTGRSIRRLFIAFPLLSVAARLLSLFRHVEEFTVCPFGATDGVLNHSKLLEISRPYFFHHGTKRMHNVSKLSLIAFDHLGTANVADWFEPSSLSGLSVGMQGRYTPVDLSTLNRFIEMHARTLIHIELISIKLEEPFRPRMILPALSKCTALQTAAVRAAPSREYERGGWRDEVWSTMLLLLQSLPSEVDEVILQAPNLGRTDLTRLENIRGLDWEGLQRALMHCTGLRLLTVSQLVPTLYFLEFDVQAMSSAAQQIVLGKLSSRFMRLVRFS